MCSFNLNYYGAASEITANLLPTPFSDTGTISFDPNMTNDHSLGEAVTFMGINDLKFTFYVYSNHYNGPPPKGLN